MKDKHTSSDFMLCTPNSCAKILGSIVALLIYSILANFVLRDAIFQMGPDFATEALSIFVVGLPLIAYSMHFLRRNALLVEELTSLSRTDPLTRLLNRGAFEADTHALSPKGGMLVILDVDHFKRLNDSYGHPAGDAVLKQIAQHLTGMVRSKDVVARIGGEEFGLFLTGAPADNRLTNQQLHLTVTLPRGMGERAVTLSAGVVHMPPGMEFEQAMRRADRALYRAKATGRARLAVYSETADAA